jgi:putative DNA primase/helicase
MSDLLEAALSYARAGLPVFPVGVNKAPLTPHGFKDATTDEDAIRLWWSEHPEAGIGIPTGEATAIIVLDIDPRHDGDKTLVKLLAEYAPLPPGPITKTGGGGQHFWFLHPGGHVPVAHGFQPGLDLQADGAYVVVPPSPHRSGHNYEWIVPLVDGPKLPLIPPWLLKLAVDPVGTRGAPFVAPTPAGLSDQELLAKVFAGPCGDLHRVVFERHLSREHVKDHPAYVAFCTALLLAGAAEDQVPRILGFTAESWERNGRAQWRHLMSKGGYYRKRETLVRASAVYREALDLLARPRETDGVPLVGEPQIVAPAPEPPSGTPPPQDRGDTRPIPGDLFTRNEKTGAWVADYPAFAQWFRSNDRFVVPIERGTFSSPAKFELLRYEDGYYNGQARAFIRRRTEDAFRARGIASRDTFREEVVKVIGNTSEFHRNRADFNPPGALCLQNGVLDTGTLAIGPHTPDIVFTWKIPVTYDPAATCPRFDQFLAEVMPDEVKRERLVDLLGYCLWRRNKFQQWFLIVGDGANGKTVYLNVIQALLGPEAISTASMHDLSSDKWSPAELDGKLVNICDDLPYDRKLGASGILKTLTGEGTRQVQRKGEHPFTLRFEGKIISAANRTPETDDDTYAFWRRLILIEFEQVFAEDDPRRDPLLMDKLRAELPGILNRALEGLARIRARTRFDPTDAFKGSKEKYHARADPIRAELLEDFKADTEGFVPNYRLYERHVQRATGEGREPMDKRSFGHRVARAFPMSRTDRQRVAGNHVWGKRGISERAPSPVLDEEALEVELASRRQRVLGDETAKEPATAFSHQSEPPASPVLAGSSPPSNESGSGGLEGSAEQPARTGDVTPSAGVEPGEPEVLPGADSRSSDKPPSSASVDQAEKALLDAIGRGGEIPFEIDRVAGWLEKEGHERSALSAAIGRVLGAGVLKRLPDGRYQLKKEASELEIDLGQTGVGQSQRERLVMVLDTASRIQKQDSGTFSLEALLTEMERAGVARARTEAIVLALRNQGEIIEVRPGRFQVVRY